MYMYIRCLPWAAGDWTNWIHSTRSYVIGLGAFSLYASKGYMYIMSTTIPRTVL